MRPRIATRCVRVLLAAVLSLAMLATPLAAQQARLYTYSTIDALMAGVYDGELTVAELRTHADFGIGTFNRLDGEMVLLDGVCYHAHSDGSVSVAGPQQNIPLVYATRFSAASVVQPGALASLQELEQWLDRRLPNRNLFYAVRIDGLFRDVAVRAIAPQTPPYKPLAEVALTQVVRQYAETRGTLIGFRSPPFSRGISVPGYHWHFLTEDRKRGGRVLKMKLAEGNAQTQEIAAVDLDLPRSEEFARADQEKNREEDVKRVEGK